MKRLGARACLLLSLSAACASASPLTVPLHVPPRLRPEPSKAALDVGAGWLALRAPGLALEGAGGGWELSGAAKRVDGHVHADAFGLTGRGGRGFTASVEGDISWAPAGREAPWRLYGGSLVNVTQLSLPNAGVVTLVGGKAILQPTDALTFATGLPFGADARWRAGARWAFEANAHVVAWLGGGTIFTYGPAAIPSRERSRRGDPSLSAGGRLRAEFLPARLSVEAGGSAATSSGGNDGRAVLWSRLAWRVL